MSRRLSRSFAALLLVVAGCHSESVKEKRFGAEQRWNSLRAGVQQQLAEQHIENGSFDQAMESLTKSVRMNPEDPVSYRLMTRCCLAQGLIAQAAEAAARARACGDESAELSYMMGVIAEARSNLDDAINHYSHAQNLEPDKMEHVVARAECLIAEGRWPEAESLLDDTIERFARHPDLLLLRAAAREFQNDWSGAVLDCQEARDHLGDDWNYDERLGTLLVRAGRFSEAIDVLGPLVSRIHDRAFTGQAGPSPAVIRAAAQAYLHTHQSARARRLLDTHLQTNPDDANAWWLLAEVAADLHDVALMDQCAQRGAKLLPDRPQWPMIRAYIAWEQDRPRDTLAVLVELLRKNPDYVPALCLAGEAHRALGEQDQARDRFRAAASIDPNCQWAYQRLAELTP